VEEKWYNRRLISDDGGVAIIFKLHEIVKTKISPDGNKQTA
jgi:hypothetical protein